MSVVANKLGFKGPVLTKGTEVGVVAGFAAMFGGDMLVKAGVVDDAAKVAYTQGQCHALALALYELTGWELWYSGFECEDRFCEAKECWEDIHTASHIFVVTPDGAAVDINGAKDLYEYTAVEGMVSNPLTEEEFLDVIVPDNNWAKMHMPAARAFALSVLERMGNA